MSNHTNSCETAGGAAAELPEADKSSAVNRRRRTMRHSAALTAHTSPCRASYATLVNDGDGTSEPRRPGVNCIRATTSANLLTEHALLNQQVSDGSCAGVLATQSSVDSEQLSTALSCRLECPQDGRSVSTSQNDGTAHSLLHAEPPLADFGVCDGDLPCYLQREQYDRLSERSNRCADERLNEHQFQPSVRTARLSVAGLPSRPLHAHLSGQFVQLRDVGVMTDVAELKRSVSAVRLAEVNPLGNIGLEMMKLCGAVPGFRQLQKVSSISVQSNESLDKPVGRTKPPTLAFNKALDGVSVSYTSRASSKKRPFKRHSTSDKSQPEVFTPIYNGPFLAATPILDTHVSLENRCRSPSGEHVALLTCAETDAETTGNSITASPALQGKTAIGFRLGRRRTLYEKRRAIADYSLTAAAIGILLTVLETELTMDEVYSKHSVWSQCMKLGISLSTAVLLAFLIAYHAVEVQLFSIDNCIEDWRVAINSERIIRLVLELLICAVHPLPFTGTFKWVVVLISGEKSEKDVPIDALLALPVFLRLYLIFRVMLLHSKIFTDASSRSIGALNRIKFNIRFVLKTMMTICPGTLLLVLILSLLLVASWTIRLCESYHEAKYNSILNALWFASITFLSIGYGDVVPSSVCGRLIAITTGVIGSGCTALVVAVVATKLELSRAEKHVHNFMMDTQLTKQLKCAAANVLRETWLIYKYTKLTKKVNAAKVRAHQRFFLKAIQTLRRVKLDQRKLTENSMRLTDLPKLHNQLHEILTNTRQEQLTLTDRVHSLEDKLHSFEQQIDDMPRKVLEAFLPHLRNLLQPTSSSPNFSLATGSNRFAPKHTAVASASCVQTPCQMRDPPRLRANTESPDTAPAVTLEDARRFKLRLEAVTQTTFTTSTATHLSASRMASREMNGQETEERVRPSAVELASRRLVHTDACISPLFDVAAMPQLASAENSSLSMAGGELDRGLLRNASKQSVVNAARRGKIADCPSQFRSFSHA